MFSTSAKEDWIGIQCEQIKASQNKKQQNSKRAYQTVKDLISEKQGRSTTMTSLGNVLQRKKRNKTRKPQQIGSILLILQLLELW